MDAVVADGVATRRLVMLMLTIFAGVALVLAGLGIYAVMAHSVAERRSELAIRMALGADKARVLRLVLGQSAMTTAIGPGAWPGGRDRGHTPDDGIALRRAAERSGRAGRGDGGARGGGADRQLAARTRGCRRWIHCRRCGWTDVLSGPSSADFKDDAEDADSAVATGPRQSRGGMARERAEVSRTVESKRGSPPRTLSPLPDRPLRGRCPSRRRAVWAAEVRRGAAVRNRRL